MLEELDCDDILLLKAMSVQSKLDTRSIMLAVNFKRTKFYNCMNKLIRLGLVNRVLTGEYELTEKGKMLAERLVDPMNALEALRGDGQPLKLKMDTSEMEVRNLSELREIVDRVKDDDLYRCVRTGSLSRWLHNIGDTFLSRELNKLRTTVTKDVVKERLKTVLDERVKFLEMLISKASSRRGRFINKHLDAH